MKDFNLSYNMCGQRTSEDVETTPQKKKGKATKDKNAPKKGKSAYNYFIEESLPKLKAANPEATMGTLMKMCGENWKQVTPEEKAAFEEKASGDKQR